MNGIRMIRRASLLLLLLGAHSFAQPGKTPATLSAAEVLHRLETGSPALAEAKAELARAKAEYTSSRALPNPDLFIEDERLEAGALEETEQTVGVRQNVSFLWTRPQELRAQGSAYEAARAAYRERLIELQSEVLIGFRRYENLRRQSALADSIQTHLRELSRRAAARLETGDVSEYDVDRFRSAVIQHRGKQLQIEQELAAVRLQLIGLTGLPAHDVERVNADDVEVIPPFANEEEALEYAEAHSPKLAASRAAMRAADRRASAAKWSLIPDLNIAAGRKQASGGFDGTVLEAELELPIFGQGRSAVQRTTAERRAAERRHASVKHEVATEIGILFARWDELVEYGLEDHRSSDSNRALRRATVLYFEGEIGALELVDAMNAAFESASVSLDLELTRLITACGIRKLCGYSLEE